MSHRDVGIVDDLEIAIIGMSGRFPGAKNIDQFWDNLKNSVESITFFTDDELLNAGVAKELLSNPKFVKAGALLGDVDRFDASFFGFSPREAEILDPQQRILLEGAWEALENAGYDPETYQGLIGVYVGAGLNTYMLNLLGDRQVLESNSSLQLALANDKDYLATRISYKLNLKGSSITVQTACSTSLVAVHMACQSLLNYDTDIALAGGVSVRVPHRGGYLYDEGSILSPDGHCRAFDEKANGTVFGNGMGLVVLKRLKHALEDGDYIHAVIKGSAINNDGSVKVGFTAPSVEGQAKVIADALSVAGIDKESISYIETHGTGTALGDPIEIEALQEVFGRTAGIIKIGSVKTNIGHLDTAAGVTGLIKTVMALKHKQIPASLNFQKPNPQIQFSNTPFEVNTRLIPWEPKAGVRRAGVSSFGMGGTNAHVIVEEAPVRSSEPSKRPYQLILLSAKTGSALGEATDNLVRHLKTSPVINLADVAYTTAVGRRSFTHRRFVVARDAVHTAEMLEALEPLHVQDGMVERRNRPVVFMFSGQGSQYVNMAKELYESEPVFREVVDYCSEYLKPLLDFDLRDVLYPHPGQEQESTHRLTETVIAQPALFVTEYALAKLFREWGIEPSAMIGHSVGEFVAACLAGVFSLEDGLTLITTRGRLMQKMESGSMLVVGLSETELTVELEGSGVDIAAVNGSQLCVVSGSTEAVEALATRLTAQGRYVSRLHTSHAFHSSMMEAILEEFASEVGKIQLNKPDIPYISNVTGTWITEEQAIDPLYYAKHLRTTVRFGDGLQVLLRSGDYVLLEIGPGETLTKIAKRSAERGRIILSTLRPPTANVSDYQYLFKAVGSLWVAGTSISWKGFYGHEKRHRVPLPTYPFERQRYWIDVNPNNEYVKVEKGKKANIKDWFYRPVWKRALPLKVTTRTDLKLFLLFGDERHVTRLLAERLTGDGYRVLTVIPGEEFAQIDECTYVMNPKSYNHYYRLIKYLSEQGQLPEAIVHMWTFMVPPEIDSLGVGQELGFNSLLYLAQAIGNAGISDNIEISILTDALFDITGSERLVPEKALLIGPAKVIHQEIRNLKCRVLDMEIPDNISDGSEERWIQNLVTELTVPINDRVVAYRGTNRWLQSFEPFPMDGNDGDLPLRKKGTYLITGGLGGIGLLFAEYLARTVQANLVLLSRSGLPPRETWHALLNEPNVDEDLTKKIQSVLALEELGSEVQVVTADVTDRVTLKRALEQVEQRFGKVNGVFHAAGVPGGGLLALKTPEVAQGVLAPKVNGTLLLNELLDMRNLDFFILFSSILSITGGLGQVDYTAANAFLDAFAHMSHARHGMPVMAIDWDSWQIDSWQEAAMASMPEIQAQIKELRNRYGIKGEEGVKVMEIALRNLMPQVVVSTKDLATTIDKHAFYTEIAIDKESSSNRVYSRQLEESTYVAPRNEVEETVASIWQEVLGIEKIGVKDNFIDLGGHSLLAAQLISRMREAFQVDLPLQALFDRPTVEQMSELIFELILNQVEALSDEEIAAILQDEGAVG